MPYLGLFAEYNDNSSTIASISNTYISENTNITDACISVYKHYLKNISIKEPTDIYKYYIEYYDMNSSENDMPERTYYFDKSFNCINYNTSEIVWQP
jgi:hypothetical protein